MMNGESTSSTLTDSVAHLPVKSEDEETEEAVEGMMESISLESETAAPTNSTDADFVQATTTGVSTSTDNTAITSPPSSKEDTDVKVNDVEATPVREEAQAQHEQVEQAKDMDTLQQHNSPVVTEESNKTTTTNDSDSKTNTISAKRTQENEEKKQESNDAHEHTTPTHTSPTPVPAENPETSTTKPTTAPTPSNDKQDDAKDEVIAAQMAAVAAAAVAATDSQSPSAAATYAKGISATMVNLPPPPPPPPPPGGIPPKKKRRKRRIGVHVDLVREELMSRMKSTSSSKSEQDGEEEVEDMNVDLDVNMDATTDVHIKDEAEVTTSKDVEDTEGGETVMEKRNVESSTSTSDETIKQKDHEESQGITSEVTTKAPKRLSAMTEQISTGKNDLFLRNLLFLTSHNCIASQSEGINCSSPPTPQKTVASQEGNEEESESKEKVYSDTEKATAVEAANKVTSLMGSIEEEYKYMQSLLPPPLSESTSLDDDDESLNDGLMNYDDEDFEIHSCEDDAYELPDLLPSCTSQDGDATATFFHACRPSSHSNPKALSSDTSVSSKSSMTNQTNDSSAGKGGIANNYANSNRPQSMASSIVSSVISTVKGGGQNGGVFSKVRALRTPPQRRNEQASTDSNTQSDDGTVSTLSTAHHDDLEDVSGSTVAPTSNEYNVVITKDMLGLTVENVLERTVVRTVLPNGAAKKAGARVGSLIVNVGQVETANLTHFETIDELRQSQRPLKLVLREISMDALRGAREEMGRLIHGGGFGTSLTDSAGSVSSKDGLIKRRGSSDFCDQLHHQWIDGTKRALQSNNISKKDEALSKIGEKLVWITTLLVIGLEEEAIKSKNDESAMHYSDAAKSVSKILHDYVQKHFEKEDKKAMIVTKPSHDNPRVRKKQIAPPPHIIDKQRNALPGTSKRSSNSHESNKQLSSGNPTENALLRIGDVLHRITSFWADPTSPPAALLRGEMIALLCDVLNVDTDMTLSEEDTGGSINDLGSAGSLLKLIVLNCSMIRNQKSISLSRGRSRDNPQDTDDLKFHAGNRFLAVVHRLAASQSTSARVTACSLGPVLWGRLDFPHQLQLRGVITRALHDVEVIVRKSTATVLHEIAELVFDSRAVPWLVLMCERAMTDPEPQLRSAAMTLTWHLAEHLPNAFYGDASKGSRSLRGLPPREDPTYREVYLLQCKLLPVATRLAEDRAAPVRLAVAAQCDRLTNALGEHWYIIIIDLLQALLDDEDEKVRSEAVLCVPRLVSSVLLAPNAQESHMSINVLDSLLPVTHKLFKDPSRDVRVSLATAAGELLTLLVALQSMEEITISVDGTPGIPNYESGKTGETKIHQKNIDDTLIPLLQTLLHDVDPEVTSSALRAVTNASRGTVREISSRRRDLGIDDDSLSLASSSHISSVASSIEKKDPVFIPVLSEEQVLRLLPTLSDLATSAQWRVRQSAVEIVPALLSCTHRIETRSEIAQLCVKLMDDSVDAVRKTAAECLCLGGGNSAQGGSDQGGVSWLTKIVFPHVEACRDSEESKQRLLSLKMVEIILVNGACRTVGKPSVNILTPSERDQSSSTNEQPITPIRRTLQIAAALSCDRIANVRLNVGRVFGNVIHTLEDDDLNFVITVLEEQIGMESKNARGGDRDVLFFAHQAIRLAKDRIAECCAISLDAM